MVSIIEVTTRAQLRQFVDYPNILYKDVPQFVPATFSPILARTTTPFWTIPTRILKILRL